jgi:hypothetical protein
MRPNIVSNQRFQIEEMLSQDATGAVFLAMDSRSNAEVLLQRFFPFGAGEIGLEGEELAAYGQAMERMKLLQSKRLRRIIDGGCDPVDGMPFLVTEIRSYPTLRNYCTTAALTVPQGFAFVEAAMTLMLEMEKHFGQMADWLVMDADDIEVIGEAEDFRFNMDPMKWLGRRQGPGTIKELALLAEQAMGWSGKVYTGSQAGLFAGWLRTAKTREISPVQALEFLRGGATPPSSATPSVTIMPAVAVAATGANAAAPAPVVPLASAKSGGATGWLVFGGIALVACIVVAILMMANPADQSPISTAAAQTAAGPAVVTAAENATPTSLDKAEEKPRTVLEENKAREEIMRKALELQQQAAANTPRAAPATPQLATNQPKPPKKSEYMSGDVEALVLQMGEDVTVEAIVSEVKLSSTGKTLYILFDGAATVRIIGRHLTNLGAKGMSVSELGGLEGTRVRVTGKVQKEFGSNNRLILDIQSRDQIVATPAP